MGFKILSQVELENGFSTENVYVTIQGEFRTHKNRTTGKYEVSCNAQCWKNMEAYNNKKQPLFVGLHCNLNLESVNQVDFYAMLYTKLKQRCCEVFNNNDLQFEDVL
ncbi:hypothetical protein EBU94_01905 [bacterium]|nr:hypothetical protein [bacterium]